MTVEEKMFGNGFSVRAVVNCWQYTPRRYKCTLQDAVMALENNQEGEGNVAVCITETRFFVYCSSSGANYSAAGSDITPPYG